MSTVVYVAVELGGELEQAAAEQVTLAKLAPIIAHDGLIASVLVMEPQETPVTVEELYQAQPHVWSMAGPGWTVEAIHEAAADPDLAGLAAAVRVMADLIATAGAEAVD